MHAAWFYASYDQKDGEMKRLGKSLRGERALGKHEF